MNRIRSLRKELKISAKQIMGILDIKPCNYYKKELGYLRFSLEEARKISIYFGMSIEDIFFYSEVSKMTTLPIAHF